MTDDAWNVLSDLLGSWWPGEWSERRSQAYRAALDDLEPPMVAKALSGFLDRGDRFRPSAGELRVAACGPSEVRERSAGEAWALLEEAINRVGCSIYNTEFAQYHQEAIDWLARQDEVLAAFAARRGLCGPGSLGQEPVHDPEYGGAVRHRIASNVKQAYGEAQDRMMRGLPPVPAGSLTVRGTQQASGGMRDVVEGLRPVRRLEAVPDDEAS